MGDHQNRALIGRDGILQSDLRKGIQVAGGFVQQQKVCMTCCKLCQLQQILFAAGEISHPAAKAHGIEAVLLKMRLYLCFGLESDIKELSVNSILLP